jgi:NTE family protein
MTRALRVDFSAMPSSETALPKVAAALSAFGELSPEQQAEIWSWARVRPLLSGETLVLQNTAADAIFVVVSGRFEVRVEGKPVPLAEIGVGQPIGEIAFFAGGLRTATVVAVRDSVVLELDRASFEEIARRVPAVYDQLLASLARRLAETTARVTRSIRLAAARTIALVAAGYADIPAQFFRRLRTAFAGSGKYLFLSRADLEERFPNLELDDAAITNWLNLIESEYELIIYQADAKPTEWTRKAIRQADQLFLLAYGRAAGSLNSVEEIGLAIHPASRRRLVRIHDHRVPVTTGTADWLRQRDVAMHHHVSLEDDEDFNSL